MKKTVDTVEWTSVYLESHRDERTKSGTGEGHLRKVLRYGPVNRSDRSPPKLSRDVFVWV